LEEKQEIRKLESARNLIKQLKQIFGYLIKSDKKYSDPTPVLKSLTDTNGRPLEIGDERDIGEFNDTFLSRV
jgi:ubiquitin carboxyl-terminal hydrolase 25/28